MCDFEVDRAPALEGSSPLGAVDNHICTES